MNSNKPNLNITPTPEPTPTPKRLLIMAGGTGGHVFPGLAVAKRLQSLGWETLWLGTRQGLESKIVPAAGIPLQYLTITGLRGKSRLTWALAPFRLLMAFFQALRAMLRFKPDVVLGMGGFVAGPGGVAAWVLRRPLVIHEQNAIAGVTNRYLSYLAQKVLEAFPNSFQNPKVITVGNPVREELLRVPNPADRMKDRQGLRVLVVGGSLGALALNQLCPKTFSLMSEALSTESRLSEAETVSTELSLSKETLSKDTPIEIWHQTGAQHSDLTQSLYSKANLNPNFKVKITPFIDNIGEAYSWADIVICRAGAITVSELMAVGVGSILIPFPFAVDDHQTYNGRFLQSAGAAYLIQQKDLTPEDLKNILQSLVDDRTKLLFMAEKAHGLAKREALDQVINSCMEIAL